MGACVSQPLASRLHCTEAYVVQGVIARGGQGTVWLANQAVGDGNFALKAMTRGMTRQEAAALVREVQCSLALGAAHVNVVRPHELLITSSHVLLATRLSSGGSLEAYVRRLPVAEPLARYFFRQVVAALQYCHSQDVSFRDLKLANILLDGHDPPWLQLCDFGVARRAPKKHYNTLVGTPGYISPQVLGVAFDAAVSSYDGFAADVWSAGACLFAMLSNGSLPFNFDRNFDRTVEEFGLNAALRRAWRDEASTPWHAGCKRSRFTADLGDLLDRLLEPDEGKRIDFSGARAHAWTAAHLADEYAAALSAQEQEQAKLGHCDAECHLHDTDEVIERSIMLATKLGAGRGVEARVGLWPEECRKRAQTVRSNGEQGCSTTACGTYVASNIP